MNGLARRLDWYLPWCYTFSPASWIEPWLVLWCLWDGWCYIQKTGLDHQTQRISVIYIYQAVFQMLWCFAGLQYEQVDVVVSCRMRLHFAVGLPFLPIIQSQSATCRCWNAAKVTEEGFFEIDRSIVFVQVLVLLFWLLCHWLNHVDIWFPSSTDQRRFVRNDITARCTGETTLHAVSFQSAACILFFIYDMNPKFGSNPPKFPKRCSFSFFS